MNPVVPTQPASRRPPAPERLMARYVPPTMLTAVARFCLALMCLAIVDGFWLAAHMLAVLAILLACAAAACRRVARNRSAEGTTYGTAPRAVAADLGVGTTDSEGTRPTCWQ